MLYFLQRNMADVRPKSRSQDGEDSSAPQPCVENRDSSPEASVVLDGEDKTASPVKELCESHQHAPKYRHPNWDQVKSSMEQTCDTEYQPRDTTVNVGSR